VKNRLNSYNIVLGFGKIYRKVFLLRRKTLIKIGKLLLYLPLDFLSPLLFKALDLLEPLDLEEFPFVVSDLESIMDLSSLFFVVAILFRI
jgi:hypothetical protein